jgi:hypothetical protein
MGVVVIVVTQKMSMDLFKKKKVLPHLLPWQTNMLWIGIKKRKADFWNVECAQKFIMKVIVLQDYYHASTHFVLHA